uniref:Cryptide Pep-21 n=1 Tax=Tityus obscurus TaxID=1221240 RepID=CRY21_TITOB
TVPDLEM